ncbi:MAG: helix-turn-helix domain-containing protein [Ignavibacteriales bacterium]|nr:helix-turn-helix domain-containing protein [Ignavibacteriales bacterium]
MKTFWLLRFLKPIKTKKDYEAALEVIEKNFFAKKGTAEANILKVLSILVGKYEEENFPFESPHPVEAIKFRREQLDWTNKDLAKVVGGKNRVSEILNRRRNLSLEMIRRIHKKMHIPTDVLIST